MGRRAKASPSDQGAAHDGGVGGGVSPTTALSVGLKVDVDALPASVVAALKNKQLDLSSPDTTLALLQLNAVLGVTGFFNSSKDLTSIGIQCAFCHSTVDDSFAPGIGHRPDGWAIRDLNVGAIVNLAPDLSVPATVLGVPEATVRTVLQTWGPGRFDAELFMDGQGVPPGQLDRGHIDPSGVRARRRQSPHVDGVGLGDLLERVRREPGDAWQGNVL